MVLRSLLYKCFLWAFFYLLGGVCQRYLSAIIEAERSWNETGDPGSPAGTEGRALINVTYGPYHFCVLRSISLGSRVDFKVL